MGLESAYGQLESLRNGELDGEACLCRIRGSCGEVGFIATVSQPFCASCTRARLTADGRLRLCLLREKEIDLLGLLCEGASGKTPGDANWLREKYRLTER